MPRTDLARSGEGPTRAEPLNRLPAAEPLAADPTAAKPPAPKLPVADPTAAKSPAANPTAADPPAAKPSDLLPDRHPIGRSTADPLAETAPYRSPVRPSHDLAPADTARHRSAPTRAVSGAADLGSPGLESPGARAPSTRAPSTRAPGLESPALESPGTRAADTVRRRSPRGPDRESADLDAGRDVYPARAGTRPEPESGPADPAQLLNRARPDPDASAADPARRQVPARTSQHVGEAVADQYRTEAAPGNGVRDRSGSRPAGPTVGGSEPWRGAPAPAASGKELARHRLPPPAPHAASRSPGFNPNSARPQLATDGSWSWGPARLTTDQVRIAEDSYDQFRAAAGRDLFGRYGNGGLTGRLRRVEEQLEHARLAPQTDERALLEPDVFRARFADMLRRHPDRSAELLASRVPGTLSYTFIFGPDHYASGIRLVQNALEDQGFELQARKNSWNNTSNRCVYTMWHDPTSNLPFEVQFHTNASLEAQQLARTSAPLINDPRIPPEEVAGLQSDLASAWAALPSPPGNAEISDYRRYGSGAARR
jgi:hypothetical protein